MGWVSMADHLGGTQKKMTGALSTSCKLLKASILSFLLPLHFVVVVVKYT